MSLAVRIRHQDRLQPSVMQLTIHSLALEAEHIYADRSYCCSALALAFRNRRSSAGTQLKQCLLPKARKVRSSPYAARLDLSRSTTLTTSSPLPTCLLSKSQKQCTSALTPSGERSGCFFSETTEVLLTVPAPCRFALVGVPSFGFPRNCGSARRLRKAVRVRWLASKVCVTSRP